MTQLETKIINFIAESLGADGEEITLKSSLRKDLGAETLAFSEEEMQKVRRQLEDLGYLS